MQDQVSPNHGLLLTLPVSAGTPKNIVSKNKALTTMTLIIPTPSATPEKQKSWISFG